MKSSKTLTALAAILAAAAAAAATGNKPNGNKTNYWRGDRSSTFNDQNKGGASEIRPAVTEMRNWETMSGTDWNKNTKNGVLPGGSRVVDVGFLYRDPSVPAIRVGVDRERGWGAGQVALAGNYSMQGSIGIGQTKNEYFPVVFRCDTEGVGLNMTGGSWSSGSLVKKTGNGNFYVGAYGGLYSDEDNARLRINGGTHVIDNIFIGSSDKNASQDHHGYVVITNQIMCGNNDGAGPIEIYKTPKETIVKTRQSVGLYNGELLVGSSGLEIRTEETASSQGLYLGSDGAPHDVSMKVENGTLTNHGETKIGGNYAEREGDGCTASLAIDGGTATFEGDVTIGYGRGAAGDVSKLVIKNGAAVAFAASANTLTVGRNGNAILQIDNATLSMPAATIAVFSTAGSAKPDRTARVELGEGATIETKGISHGASSGKGEVLIDGGTLKAAAGNGAALVGKFNPYGQDSLADGSFSVKVGAKGATIDTAGFDVKIGEDVASGVESGKDGGVAFTGGGSVAFSYTDGDNAVQPASAGWTGGTKVALGTELKFATLASARTLLAGGAKVVAPAEIAEAQTAIISLPADSAETFGKSDLANVSIVDADGARAKGCYAALSSDAKSIVAKASGAVLMVK